jgi:hypothetical protein
MYKKFIVNDSNRKLYPKRHKQIIPKNKEKTKFENINYKRFTLIMVNIASHLIKDLWRSKNMFFNKEKGKKEVAQKHTVSQHYISLRVCETKCIKKLKFGCLENFTYCN